MIDPVAELIRAGDTECLAELYEEVADSVAEVEDYEYAEGFEYPPGGPADRMITLFNRCEIARLEFRKRIAAKAADGDELPAIISKRSDGL